MPIKRSQAAMEFLMTYGWALLVVIIVIAALAFFGLLNPSRFLPETADLGQGLVVKDFVITQNNIKFMVQNGLGQVIYNLRINATDCTNINGSKSAYTTIVEGETRQVNITCSSTGLPGRKFTSNLVINYSTQATSSYSTTHTYRGKVSSIITGPTLLALGSFCTSGIVCASGYCDTEADLCTTGSPGQQCNSNNDCQSGVCSGSCS